MTKSTEPLTAFEMATLAANFAEDKKGRDTLVLNTETVSTLSDFFVVTSVESRSQMNALTDHIVRSFKSCHQDPIGVEKDKSGRWTLIDFGDVVVHVFHQEDREYYQLERYWSHATEIARHQWVQDQRQSA